MSFNVARERVAWAERTVRLYMPKMSDETVFELADEIGLFENVRYSAEERNGIDLDMTDIQLVSFAAALYAVAEMLGDTGDTHARVRPKDEVERALAEEKERAEAAKKARAEERAKERALAAATLGKKQRHRR